jgi:hypothetical protein
MHMASKIFVKMTSTSGGILASGLGSTSPTKGSVLVSYGNKDLILDESSILDEQSVSFCPTVLVSHLVIFAG